MAVTDKLATWQNDLLDMSRSNNLLYYRASGRGAGIQFQVPDTQRLFSHLAYGPWKAISLADWTANLEEEDLARALARIRTRARDDLNDRGINTLYLTFGMLEWREGEPSSELIRSPLILVPVTLSRRNLFDTFQIQRLSEDEIAINPTLREKMAHDFKIALPHFTDVERMLAEKQAEGATTTRPSSSYKVPLAAVLEAIRSGIPAAVDWKIVPEVHLGRFFFQKLVMYQDLMHHHDDILRHQLLRVLGGEGALPRTGGLVSAAELDQCIVPQNTLEILDADSSQQEAIVAAKAGASFVLQGPPGTGKSQTIANIIAETLALGRLVLFVSEKMAALEVVRQRLDEAGLGDFCLDLHNPKADKKAFLRSLEAAVYEAEQPHQREDNATWQRESDTLFQTRQRLNQYVQELHRPRFALRQTAYDAYGKLAESHDVPDFDFSIPQIDSIDRTNLGHMHQMLEDLSESREVLDRYGTYPWRDVLAITYTLELASSIRDHFGALSLALGQLDEQAGALQEALGEQPQPRTLALSNTLTERTAFALSSPLPPRAWLIHGVPQQISLAVEDAAIRTTRYAAAEERLDGVYDTGILALDHATLKRQLTSDADWAMACFRGLDQAAARDLCLRDRQQISDVLSAACGCVDDMSAAAKSLAGACHAEPPTTMREVQALGSLAQCLLDSPQPPVAWLDRKRFTSLRLIVEDARHQYLTCVHIEQALAEIYQSGYFDLDLADYARRFHEQYTSMVRYLKPGYYRDLKRLRTMLISGVMRTPAQVKADLDQAIKLQKAREWIRDHRIEYAQALENWFNGAQTNWEQVDKALTWAAAFHERTKMVTVLPGMIDLATGNPNKLDGVRAWNERLLPLWSDFTRLYPRLTQILSPVALTGSDVALDAASNNALRDGLRRLQDELGQFWVAVDEVEAHRTQPRTPALAGAFTPRWPGVHDDLAAAEVAHAFEVWNVEQGPSLAQLVGPFFMGRDTNWDRTLKAVRWSQSLLDRFPGVEIPTRLIKLVCYEGEPEQRDQVGARLAAARTAGQRITAELAFCDTVLPRSALLASVGPLDRANLVRLRARIDGLLADLPCLERWLICAQRIQACRDAGLGGMVDGLLRTQPLPSDFISIFERRFYALWLDKVRQQTPELAAFRGESRERTIARFGQLDTEHLRLAQRRVHAQLTSQRRAALSEWSEHNDDLAYAVRELKRQVQLKRHPSVRQIVQRIAPALLELKPCWMMSPLSVSQFIQSGQAIFDIVIFDEASQVCAEDAISAILRGRRAIVVGDSKQLPPTRFFARTLADSDDDDEDTESQPENERVESILNECLASGFEPRSLRWHYRSRHESLIAFSNHHFYHDDLITFPSPDAQHADGVRFEVVADGVYDRGRSRTNRREAERVADIVFEHVRTRPELSLGVVALSGAQQQAIQDAIDTRLRQDEFKAWADKLDQDNPTGFFIKNLESVQGDERDVIVLSVGYGKPADGRLRLNFGPVNKPGGERRLNVAVTRARHQMILVTSIRASDFPAESANPGVRTLRDYLDYAEHGPATLGEQSAVSNGVGQTERTAPQFDSPFEAAVYTALQAKGLDLDTQVGCSGYRIDLAVRDPIRPGTYLLGIECDGRTYHMAHTARDRDRLRQRHLERMGWQIHRIWSSDWVSDPAGEVTKVLERLRTLTA